MQINNLKIKLNKESLKYKIVAPDGRVLREFEKEEDAVDWCEECSDFVGGYRLDTVDECIEKHRVAGCPNPVDAAINTGADYIEPVAKIVKKIYFSGCIDTAIMKMSDLIDIARFIVAKDNLSIVARIELKNIRRFI